MTVLAPLAARYAAWLGLPASVVSDLGDEQPVRAMQLVLRVERTAPPPRTALLEAAAAAAVAVCLDPRSAPDGEWHTAVAAWVTGRIRKVSRRARGAHWHAVSSLPGLTVSVPDAAPPPPGVDGPFTRIERVDGPSAPIGGGAGEGGAQVRALVPGPVTELPREVSRLQVAGTDLPADEPGPVPEGVPVLWLNPSVPMTVGKAAAQVGHATMIAAALLEAAGEDATLAEWAEDGYRVAVRTAGREQWRELHPGAGGHDCLQAWRRRRVAAVRDAGYTEVAPGTVTVLAQLPAW